MKKGDNVYLIKPDRTVDFDNKYTVLEVQAKLAVVCTPTIDFAGAWIAECVVINPPSEEDIILAFDAWEKQGDCDPFSAFKAGIQLNKF